MNIINAKPFIVKPTAIPDTLLKLNQSLKTAFQHKNTDSDLLKHLGQQLWVCADLEKQDFHIQATPIIIQTHQHLAWECLYHPDGYFIAQHTPIIRQTALTARPSLQLNTPLKILHFTTQATHPQQDHLNFAEEQYWLYQTLWQQIQSRHVLFHSASNGTFNQLQQLLTQDWDIIIFSGHTVTQQQQQHLVFESEQEPYQLISHAQFISLFQEISTQCILLAVCESKILSAQLHQLGVAHVIGMQQTVLDRAASVFIQQFCKAVVQGEHIEMAVKMARSSIMHGLLAKHEQWLSEHNIIGQWSIPCFYTHHQSDVLFQPALVENIKNIKPILFIGQRQQKEALERYLCQYKKVWLHGIGGIGKTALARAVHQSFLAQHQSLTYIEADEVEDGIGDLSKDQLTLVVSRQKPSEQNWKAFKLAAPTEKDFIDYAQYQGLTYPILQLRLIYKLLQGNYQGLHLLKGLPFTTDAVVLRQQLSTIQRYLQAYQRIKM